MQIRRQFFSPDADGGGGAVTQPDVNAPVSGDEFLSLKEAVRGTMGSFGRTESPEIEEEHEDTTEKLPPGLTSQPIAGGGAIPPHLMSGQKKTQETSDEKAETVAGKAETKTEGEEPGKADGKTDQKADAADQTKVMIRRWDQDFTQEQVEKVFDACKSYHETRAEFDAAVDKFTAEQEQFTKVKADFEAGPAFQMSKFLEENPGVKEAMLAFIEKKAPEFAAKVKEAAKSQEIQAYEAKIADLEKQLGETKSTVEKTQAEVSRRAQEQTAKEASDFLDSRIKELGTKHDITLSPKIAQRAKQAAMVAMNTVDPQTGKPTLTFEAGALKKFFENYLNDEVTDLVAFRDQERSRHLNQKRNVPAPPPADGRTVKHSPKGPTNWKQIQEETHRKLNEVFQK